MRTTFSAAAAAPSGVQAHLIPVTSDAAVPRAAGASRDELVAVLEGGYHPEALGRSVAATLRAFDGIDGSGPAARPS